MVVTIGGSVHDPNDPVGRLLLTALGMIAEFESDLIKMRTREGLIYDAGRRYRNERERRAACLRAIVEDAARSEDTMLVLEQDDSLVSWDNST